MALLRPLLVAVLGAFVAAAPVAPVPGRVKKERKSPTDGDRARGHDQKLEEPERQAPPEASAHRAKACAATGDEREPGPVGGTALRDTDRSDFWCAPPVPTARLAPTPLPAAGRRADLRAGLLALPPPAPRCS